MSQESDMRKFSSSNPINLQQAEEIVCLEFDDSGSGKMSSSSSLAPSFSERNKKGDLSSKTPTQKSRNKSVNNKEDFHTGNESSSDAEEFVLHRRPFKGVNKKRYVPDDVTGRDEQARKVLRGLDQNGNVIRETGFASLGMLKHMSSDCLSLVLQFAVGELHDVHNVALTCKAFWLRMAEKRDGVRRVIFQLYPEEVGKFMCNITCSTLYSEEESDTYRAYMLNVWCADPEKQWSQLHGACFGCFKYIPAFLYRVLPDMDHKKREKSDKITTSTMLQTYDALVRNHNNGADEIALMLCNYACGGTDIDFETFYNRLIGEEMSISFLKSVVTQLLVYVKRRVDRYIDDEIRRKSRPFPT